MTQDLAGRIAVVTGAAGGIGSVTAETLAAAGASVLLIDRHAEALTPVVELIEAAGGTAVAHAVDLRDEEATRAAVSAAQQRWGRVDVLANIAGLFPANEGPLHESVRKTWDLSLEVNLRAAAVLSAAVLPLMMQAGSGSIVNVSSAQGRAGDIAWSSYGVAKAGVESLTRYTATQYGGAGIRCNCVAPGMIATPGALGLMPPEKVAAIRAQTPLARLGRPDEIAEVVLFLASDRSSFLTGQVIAVDGGMLCHMPPS